MAEAVCGESSPMNEVQPSQEHTTPPDRLSRKSGPEFAAASQPSYAYVLFFGPDGLRPGWGFAFYAVTFLALQKIAALVVDSHDFGASGLWAMLLAEFGFLLAAVIPAIILTRVEQRPWATYGLPVKSAFGRLFWVGTVWGF